MKVIAFYLPQFHEIAENNEWWGEGFTEWVNVKNAKPLTKNHNQPHVPLNNNYYNLLNDDVKKWQIDLAKEYGIYGFCMYHYWFNGHLLLEKPVEQFLKNKELDFPFCLCWANENWTNVWAAEGNKILISQTYGDQEEWERHFEYFLPFFKDNRYIKEDGCPLLVIYKPDIMENMNEIFDCWRKLAIKNGFNGLKIASQFADINDLHGNDSRIDYFIEYQPNFAARWVKGNIYNKLRLFKKGMVRNLGRIFKTTFFTTHSLESKLEIRDYDTYWKAIINHRPDSVKSIPGGFVDWDNTPRKGKRGSVFLNSSPEKFKKYFLQLIKKAGCEYLSDYIFIFAWNEWAEGGHLEPDEQNEYRYLEAIKDCLSNNK